MMTDRRSVARTVFAVLACLGSAVAASAQSPCTTGDGLPGLDLQFGCVAFSAESVELFADEVTKQVAEFPEARRITVVTPSHGVTDLGRFAGLSKLQVLNAASLSVQDVSPLAGLSGLMILGIGLDGASLAPLTQLADLRELRLTGKQTVDLSPLAGLPKLGTLSVIAAPRVEADNLRDLPALDTLTIHAPVAFGALEHLPELFHVSLGYGAIENLASVCTLTALKRLDLRKALVADLSALSRCERLETLGINDMGARDIAPLAALTRLRSLSLDGTLPATLDPVANLKDLQSLSLRGVRADLSPLRALPELTVLILPDGRRIGGRDAVKAALAQ